MSDFFEQLNARIAQYDLLRHPFYQAWSMGQLTSGDLREYARDYYHHVEAFPGYLDGFSSRLEEGELRRAVHANMLDELGVEDSTGQVGRSHSELWLDFAEGVGAGRTMAGYEPVDEVNGLIAYFSRVAREGSPAEALAAFYAYESQVPRVAQEKTRWLREAYAADERTCGYFTLHATADVHHSAVWRNQLRKWLIANPGQEKAALEAGEAAAKALWNALDGIARERLARGLERTHPHPSA
jgi:pyrroloquinoline-quinone synthase